MTHRITTKYISPTNFKGARIKATHTGYGKSITIPYPHELSGVDVHKSAVDALMDKLNLSDEGWVGWVYDSTDTGYIFMSLPAKEE